MVAGGSASSGRGERPEGQRRRLVITGVYDGRTTTAMRAYQAKLKLPSSGVTNGITWAKLRVGKY